LPEVELLPKIEDHLGALERECAPASDATHRIG
jgi:hypothetical protein